MQVTIVEGASSSSVVESAVNLTMYYGTFTQPKLDALLVRMLFLCCNVYLSCAFLWLHSLI